MTGSNHWTDIPADLYANAQMDYIDRHNYWANPEGGYGYSPSVTYDPRSMMRDSQGNLLNPLGRKRVLGMPYIVTEWQSAAPNDYREEAELVMATACDLQGWSALEFAFSHSDSFDGALDNNFNVDNQPAQMALWPATALLFHRQDVKESRTTAWQPLTDEEALDPEAAYTLPPLLSWMRKTGVKFTGTSHAPSRFRGPPERRHENQEGVQLHEGSHLRLRPGPADRGFAPDAGFSGFAPGAPLTLSGLSVDLKNNYGVVLVQSLNAKPIEPKPPPAGDGPGQRHQHGDGNSPGGQPPEKPRQGAGLGGAHGGTVRNPPSQGGPVEHRRFTP